MEKTQKHRLFQILIIISICILPLIIKSTSLLHINIAEFYKNYSNTKYMFDLLGKIVFQLSCIFLVFFFLLKSNTYTFKSLGFSISLKDVIHSIILLAIIFVSYKIYIYLINYFYYQATGNQLQSAARNMAFYQQPISVLYVAFLFINPFFEELIGRVYLYNEINSLSQKKYLAVLIPALLQFSYHLYQGIVPAVSIFFVFLLFSFYYMKFKRFTPIFIAHLVLDLQLLFC